MPKAKTPLTLKLFFLIVLTDVTESIAELFFKKGAIATGIDNVTPANLIGFLLKIISTVSLWAGVFFYGLNFAIWIVVLSRLDLSAAAPIGSTTYIIVPLLSIIFLNEQVSLLRWVGIAFIIVGVLFVSRSTKIEHVHQ